MERERDRDRIHARERDMMGYNLNEEELINERHYGGDYERERDRGGGGGGGGNGGVEGRGGEGRGGEGRGGEGRGGVNMRERGVERERGDPRDRDRAHLALNSTRHLVNNSSNYDDNVDLIRERDKEKDRYVQQNQSQLLQPQSRRDRDDYSPHRGNNRRVLNAAM